MSIPPAEIREKRLKRRLHGYSRAEVEKLFERVAASYEEVWRERDRLRARVEQLEKELAPLKEAERHVSDILVTAERAASEVREQAKRDAKELLEAARKKIKQQQAGAKQQRTRLEAEIQRLAMVEGELLRSLRAFLLAGLELVEDREERAKAPIVEVPPASRSADSASVKPLSADA